MHAPHLELPPVNGGRPDPSYARTLEEGWARGLERGAVSYDPKTMETLFLPPFVFLLLPGREHRPRHPGHGGAGGLRRPHGPCPFDAERFLAEREALRVHRAGRSYHIALNKYPVLPLHYLAIRPAGEPPETLPQRLQGALEIEDMLLLATALGHPYHLFFNSNQGSDGSRSGSSVNHWHFQIFPTTWGVLGQPPAIAEARGGVETGEIPGWPARHRLYRSRDEAALARAIWSDVERADGLDIAYNLEVTPREDGSLVAVLFPRAPTKDLELPGVGVLKGDFGGFELSGSVVVPNRKIFEWVKAHPEKSVALIRARMVEGTTWPAYPGPAPR